ncbi:glycosyltransferase [Rhodococcoides fascians]|uniref:glycosyltransferase n=1 Tax=Rhodococcoides fascians TaxID=1828 RepID=UPI0024BB6CB1|nr:glycosyltransferase [Rhodococcus fascians]MDJ0467306.1 glycosyltransferase [Rhodococcus fascians]
MKNSDVKIAILVPSLHGGGAEFVAKEWADWLVNSGYGVHVLVTTSPLAGVPPATDAPVTYLGGGSIVSRVRRLAEFIKEERVDVLLALMPYWNLLALSTKISARRTDCRVMISNRNLESVLALSLGYKFRFMNLLARRTYRFADAAIAISHPVGAEMVAKYGVDPGRLWVVPNPASGKVVRGTSVTEGAHKERRGRESSRALDLVVPARLVRQKRPELAVEAARLIADNSCGSLSVTVHFFGTGPLTSVVEKRAMELGVSIVMHGWVEDWYNKAPRDSVVLLVSVAEGFGNVLVEACAVGLVSVASSRALGVADAIVPGVTGVLVSGDTAADYARGVESARGVPPISAEGWLERFSVQSSGRELEIAISSTLDR